MKFYYLAVELNVIILLGALVGYGFFYRPLSNTDAPLALILVIMGFLLSLHFRKKYKETKVWLDEHCRESKRNLILHRIRR